MKKGYLNGVGIFIIVFWVNVCVFCEVWVIGFVFILNLYKSKLFLYLKDINLLCYVMFVGMDRYVYLWLESRFKLKGCII